MNEKRHSGAASRTCVRPFGIDEAKRAGGVPMSQYSSGRICEQWQASVHRVTRETPVC
jgi:hypothetical protein